MKKVEAFPCTIKEKSFQFIEMFNSLRTNIRFAAADKRYRKIVVTSSVAGEGKSTVAVNLAIAFAQNGSRVLLIDCDLRKPSIQKFLQIGSNVPGLTSALTGMEPIDGCIIPLQEMGIDVLLSGPIPPNPAELIGSAKMAEIVELLSAQYEYILFDSPPVSVVTDAAVLSGIADGIIFVIRHHRTKIEEAQLAKSNLELVGATVIGAVLNQFSAKKSGVYHAAYRNKQYQYEYR